MHLEPRTSNPNDEPRTANVERQPSSEQVLYPELDLARRRDRRRDASPVRREGTGGVRERDLPGRDGEVGAIQEVERLHSRLHTSLRLQLERLDERQIRVDQAGSHERIAPKVAAR